MTWFHPWVRKIPWKRKWPPTLVLWPEKPVGQRSLAATVHRAAKRRRQISMHALTMRAWLDFIRAVSELKLCRQQLVSPYSSITGGSRESAILARSKNAF